MPLSLVETSRCWNVASPRRGENKFVYSVKNTFLHVEDSEEDQAVFCKRGWLTFSGQIIASSQDLETPNGGEK